MKIVISTYLYLMSKAEKIARNSKKVKSMVVVSFHTVCYFFYTSHWWSFCNKSFNWILSGNRWWSFTLSYILRAIGLRIINHLIFFLNTNLKNNLWYIFIKCCHITGRQVKRRKHTTPHRTKTSQFLPEIQRSGELPDNVAIQQQQSRWPRDRQTDVHVWT